MSRSGTDSRRAIGSRCLCAIRSTWFEVRRLSAKRWHIPCCRNPIRSFLLLSPDLGPGWPISCSGLFYGRDASRPSLTLLGACTEYSARIFWRLHIASRRRDARPVHQRSPVPCAAFEAIGSVPSPRTYNHQDASSSTGGLTLRKPPGARTVSDQANLSSFDHQQRSSNERPKDHGFKSLNDARLLCPS